MPYSNKKNYLKWLLLFSVVLVMPFIYFKSTIDPDLLPRFLFLSLVLIVPIFITLASAQKKYPEQSYSIMGHKIFLIIGLYLLITIVSITRTVNLSESLFDVLRVLLGFALFFLASIIFTKHKNSIQIFGGFVMITAFLLCIMGLCQHYNIAFQSYSGASIITATMANKNLLASLLCISFPFSLIGAQEPNTSWKMFNVLTGLLILYLILISQTRASWLALSIASITCAIIYLAWKHKRNSRLPQLNNKRYKIRYILFTVLLILIVTGSAVLFHQDFEKSFLRAKSIFDPNYSSNSLRLTLWENSIRMFLEKPLLGVGPGNWKITAPRYGPVGRTDWVSSRFFQRPHNDYLWILTESGSLGLIGYLLIITFIFIYAFRTIFVYHDKKKAGLMILLLFGLIVYLVDAFFSFPRERIVHLSYLMLIMASILSLYHRSNTRQNNVPKTFITSILSFLLLISVFASFVGFARLRAEIHTKKALGWRAAEKWPQVINEINMAETPFYTLDPTATPLSWYRGEANFMLGNYDDAFADYNTALRQNPNHLHVLNNLATCYELRGLHDKAIEYYRKAISIFPQFDEALINLSAVLYNVRQYNEASEIIQRVSARCKDKRLPQFKQKIEEKLYSPK